MSADRLARPPSYAAVQFVPIGEARCGDTCRIRSEPTSYMIIKAEPATLTIASLAGERIVRCSDITGVTRVVVQ
jgi:hypothetical protein